VTTLSTPPAGVDVETWARTVIEQAASDAGGTLPRYGSKAWSLARAPQRWAAAIVAAESWRAESDPAFIAERLRYELEWTAIANKHLDDEAFVRRAADHRRDWIPTLAGFRTDPQTQRDVESDWVAWVKGDAA